MLVNKAVSREWKPTGTSGIERSLFRNNDAGGRSSVVRLKKHARVPRHAHHGDEEVVVLSGTVVIGGVELGVTASQYSVVLAHDRVLRGNFFCCAMASITKCFSSAKG